MKKNTLIPKTRASLVSGATFAFALLSAGYAGAQVQHNSPTYIGNTGSFAIATGNFNFAASGTFATTRTAVTHGTLVFGQNATWTAASQANFVDGYARKINNTGSFLFPIGNGSTYAPVKINSLTAATVAAEYEHTAPQGNVDATLGNKAPTGIWKLEGDDAVITLPLISVPIGAGSGYNNLTIMGYNGTTWTVIPSTLDVSPLAGGLASMTTNSTVNFSQYSIVSFASKKECLPTDFPGGVTKTWNGGSWSPSAPGLADFAVINAPYSGNITCNTLTLNANLTIGNSQYVEIVNGVSGTGTIVMSGNANVLQRNSGAAAPKVEITKVTNPMRRFDYVFLSSPINNAASFFADLNSPATAAVNGAFGTYANSAFSNFKTINSGGSIVNVTAASLLPLGKGMRALVRSQAPYSTALTPNAWDVQTNTITIKTAGTANNGDVASPILANTWAFVGNPYPSSVSGERIFEAAGSGVRQTLYYWTFHTAMDADYDYNSADWGIWTTAGGTAACATCAVPDGSIGAMEGVYIKGNSNGGAPDFSFTNCMRNTVGGNAGLGRSAATDRYWLNMTGSNGSFTQILVAYSEEGNAGADNADGPRIDNPLKSMMSSLIDNATTRYAIQSRAAFTTDDNVALAITRANEERLTISLATKEGVFAHEDMIYLHDRVLNTYTNLDTANFSFNDGTGTDLTRFEIVYSREALSTPVVKSTQDVIALINSQTFIAEASAEISHVDIFDISGRNIMSFDVTGKSVAKAFNYAEGIYIAKIKLANGTVTTAKIVNKH